MGVNLVVAAKSDTVQACMSKMMTRDIRHLPVVDDETGQVITICFMIMSHQGMILEISKEY